VREWRWWTAAGLFLPLARSLDLSTRSKYARIERSAPIDANGRAGTLRRAKRSGAASRDTPKTRGAALPRRVDCNHRVHRTLFPPSAARGIISTGALHACNSLRDFSADIAGIVIGKLRDYFPASYLPWPFPSPASRMI